MFDKFKLLESKIKSNTLNTKTTIGFVSIIIGVIIILIDLYNLGGFQYTSYEGSMVPPYYIEYFNLQTSRKLIYLLYGVYFIQLGLIKLIAKSNFNRLFITLFYILAIIFIYTEIPIHHCDYKCSSIWKNQGYYLFNQ